MTAVYGGVDGHQSLLTRGTCRVRFRVPPANHARPSRPVPLSGFVPYNPTPMQRETRNNLIFLTILLAVMLPGGYILFRKKLDPNASRMSLPDPVFKPLPFMMPIGRPGEEQSRNMPERTGQWLDQLTLAKAGSPLFLLYHRPAISDDKRVELIRPRA